MDVRNLDRIENVFWVFALAIAIITIKDWVKYTINPIEVYTAFSPFYYHGLTLIPAWICNHIHYKMWDEITYQFLNFNGATVEV